MFVDKITIDFPIFLLFSNTKFPIFPIFSILSFLFSHFFEQPCRWTPDSTNLLCKGGYNYYNALLRLWPAAPKFFDTKILRHPS